MNGFDLAGAISIYLSEKMKHFPITENVSLVFFRKKKT